MKVRRILKQEVDIYRLGARIKEARLKSDRPLSQLAASVGISRNYWYQLEAEAVSGGVAEDTLRKIEQVLNVDLEVRFDENLVVS